MATQEDSAARKLQKPSSVRFTVTAAGFAGMLAAVPSIITATKGEPVAEAVHQQTSEVVQKITADNQAAYLKLAERIIRLEEQQHGTSGDVPLGEVLKAIKALPRAFAHEMDLMIGKRRGRKTTSSAPPRPAPRNACPTDTVESGGKCLTKKDIERRVRKKATRQMLQEAAPRQRKLPKLDK